MTDLLVRAIEACSVHQISFCKFISANDAGTTGAHQQGFYIPKNSWPLLFDSPGAKGTNKDKYVVIKWQDDFETNSRFIWYGCGTRSEYRITRFGKSFPFFSDEYVGSLLILVKVDEAEYLGYVLDRDEDIDAFLSNFGLSPTDTNNLIKKTPEAAREPIIRTLDSLISEYISGINGRFPETYEVSKAARIIEQNLSRESSISNPDKKLLAWLDVEFALFKAIENKVYMERIQTPFNSVDELVECANTLLNRRKSRAGKSLEHHLEYMFLSLNIPFTKQARTEGNKRPDFIFPGEEEYHNQSYPAENLVFLGSKTTCKDRWRQILNEADRIPHKHLFTLQQGISENQLEEMFGSNVQLVVPAQYLSCFPERFRNRIWPLKRFITMVKYKYE